MNRGKVHDIEAEFGNEVLSLVKGVTKISKISFTTREQEQAENFRKLLLAMVEEMGRAAERWEDLVKIYNACARLADDALVTMVMAVYDPGSVSLTWSIGRRAPCPPCAPFEGCQ